MSGRILKLSRTGLATHERRGFLAVMESGNEIGCISLEDIEAVLAASPGLMWSNTALAKLAARKVPVTMLAASAFEPVAVVLPLNGRHAQADRFRSQDEATKPFRKQTRSMLVRHKIAAQAEVLERIGKHPERPRRLITLVRSDDPENREVQAAQAYWPLLMGKDFRRDRDAEGTNAMLNYGYAVLRSATAAPLYRRDYILHFRYIINLVEMHWLLLTISWSRFARR